MSKIIIVNRGSTSKKYALFEDDQLLMSFHFEKTGNDFFLHQIKENEFEKETVVSSEEYEKAFDFTVDLLLKDSYINFDTDIDAVAFRIVAPGTFFASDRMIDEQFLEKLDEIREQAPMHIDKMHAEFSQVRDRLGQSVMFGISDSRFHQTMPNYASTYALPKKIIKDLDIKRFGYHGISVSSIVHKIKSQKKAIPENTIVCHLGGGASITALKNGESVETSMGYSPLEGLPMSTRIGNIDAGALISIADQRDLDMSEIRDMMYHKSGLLGLSNQTDDIRELLKLEKQEDPDGQLTLKKYIYEIQKYIGAYATILGGLDLLVFTGTVGERSIAVRNKICSDLGFLGINFDSNQNEKLEDSEGYINAPGSETSIEVIKTDESREMAIRAMDFIG
jgi:acetate kinase